MKRKQHINLFGDIKKILYINSININIKDFAKSQAIK